MTTTLLPRALYRPDELRALEKCAANMFGLSGAALMARAGQAAFDIIQRRWPQAERLLVCCGAGNNGGDGYVVAALAQRAGRQVTVLQVGARDALPADAGAAMQQALAAGVRICDAAAADSCLAGMDLVVDALLGIGLKGAVRGNYAALFIALQGCRAPVLSLDIPSGLCADTGAELGTAIRADVTVTFLALKRGLFTGRGPALCGEILFDDLALPAAAYAQVPAACERLDGVGVRAALPPRARDAHKGCFGHVLVVGGDHGYAGAALLAAEAAARTGAGLVSVATRPAQVAAYLARRPELMVHGIGLPAELGPLLQRATVVVVGPGLGVSPWARGLLAQVLQADVPLLLDADALNLLASGDMVAAGQRGAKPRWVLTPHPGEAARLLDTSIAVVQADRFAAARALQMRYGGTVLLKGAGTIIDAGVAAAGVDRPVAVATVGNPGMATGGMGDVLSGVIGGLMAQGLSLPMAARWGAVVHGVAADRCVARHGERGLLAGDVVDALREVVNGLVDADVDHC